MFLWYCNTNYLITILQLLFVLIIIDNYISYLKHRNTIIKAEKQILNQQDQLTIEWAGTYRHYHSAMFRTIPIGKADSKHYKMH